MNIRTALTALLLIVVLNAPLRAQGPLPQTPAPTATALVVDAQEPPIQIDVPQGSPWWAAIAAAALSLVFEVMRRWLNRKLEIEKVLLAQRQSTFEQTQKQQQQEWELKVLRERAQGEGSVSLANSVESLAQTITTAYTELARDRQTAGKDRTEMRETFGDLSSAVKINTDSLTELKAKTEDLLKSSKEITAQVSKIERRIGDGGEDETLTDLMRAAVRTQRQALEMLKLLKERLVPEHEADAALSPANQEK